jgi:hypothetical protein
VRHENIKDREKGENTRGYKEDGREETNQKRGKEFQEREEEIVR